MRRHIAFYFLMVFVIAFQIAVIAADKSVKPEVGASPVRGLESAKIIIFEFSDFQCPFCSQVNSTLENVIKKHKGEVKLTYKFLPLRELHPDAQVAAQAAVASQNQGKFWEMHDLLFSHQRSLARENLIKYAKELKLNSEKFLKDMDSPSTLKRIQDDEAMGHAIGFGGTPSFWINGETVVGAGQERDFEEAIQKALKKL